MIDCKLITNILAINIRLVKGGSRRQQKGPDLESTSFMQPFWISQYILEGRVSPVRTSSKEFWKIYFILRSNESC